MSAIATVDFAAVARQLLAGELPAGWHWVASSPAARVVATADYFLKLYLPRNRWEEPKRLLRGSRATRAAREAQRLARHGFYTPEICAYGRLGKIPWLATRAVAAISFGNFVVHFFDTAEVRDGLDRAVFYQQLGALVGGLHRQGIIHGDLRPNNVLLGCERGEHQFYLIDNERNRRYWWPPQRLIIKNLVQIQMLFDCDFSRAEQQQFFVAYGQARGVGGTVLKRLATASRQRVAERLRDKTRQQLVQPALTDPHWGPLVEQLCQRAKSEEVDQ